MGLPKGHPLHHPPSAAVGISSSSSIEASCTSRKVKIKSPTHVGDLSLWRLLAERQMQNLAFLFKDSSGCAAKECQNGRPLTPPTACTTKKAIQLKRRRQYQQPTKLAINKRTIRLVLEHSFIFFPVKICFGWVDFIIS
jgi:hypothetical protein